jgi:cytoskeleton protein RodZ
MPTHAHEEFKLVPPTGAEPKQPSDMPEVTASADAVNVQQLHLADVPLPPEMSLPSLTNLRLQKGHSIDAVAGALRLSPAQINALETQNWHALPGAAYIKGFLRSYARYLGVAAEGYIAQYNDSQTVVDTSPQVSGSVGHAKAPIVMHKDPTALSSFNASGHQNQNQQLLLGFVGLLVLATLAFLLFWERAAWLPKVSAFTEPVTSWVSQQFASKPAAPALPTSPAAPTEAPAAPTVASPAPALTPSPLPLGASTASGIDTNTAASAVVPADAVSAASQQAATTATGPLRTIALKVDKPVWLEIRDSGNNVIYSGIRTAGTNDTLKGAAPLSVVIGAADAMSLSVDGRPVDLIGQAKQNVTKLSIQ